MDITQSMARIVVNGIDLPFTSVRTTVINGPANDLIVMTRQRVNEPLSFYVVTGASHANDVFYLGADIMRFARVAGVDESITEEYIYHFIW